MSWRVIYLKLRLNVTRQEERHKSSGALTSFPLARETKSLSRSQISEHWVTRHCPSLGSELAGRHLTELKVAKCFFGSFSHCSKCKIGVGEKHFKKPISQQAPKTYPSSSQASKHPLKWQLRFWVPQRYWPILWDAVSFCSTKFRQNSW